MVSRTTWQRQGRPALRRLLPACALALSGCSGAQSALDPAGRDAATIARLFWWMAGGGAIVWLAVIGLAVYAFRVQPGPHERKTALLIIGGGAVAPTVVLAVLLSFGLAAMPELLAPAPPGSLRIAVTGEQFWWRVRYLPPGGAPVELANELRLPVGERVQLVLDSPDVIHSFWVPNLAGKMDMIPGRVTRLALPQGKVGIPCMASAGIRSPSGHAGLLASTLTDTDMRESLET